MEDNIDMQPADGDMFQAIPKSSVKLIKNSKGLNWEIKVVSGEENLIDGIMNKALEVHKNLIKELIEVKENGN
jgi:hypothetical protein